MASKVSTEEEREERIIAVGEYIKETGASTREVAAVFSRTCFKISNVTVSDYLHRYMKMKPGEVDALKDKIDSHIAKDVNDIEVQKRVLENTKLFLSGMTIQEIADNNGESFWTVYRDLTRRLKAIDEKTALEVKNRLEENRKSNLVRGK